MFVSSNRGKRSIALDLKQPAALEAMRRLIAGADVLVQNFRPGTMERLGLDEPAMRAVNPGLIYVSISGVGDTGPYVKKRVYDPVIQSLSGFADVQADQETGRPKMIRTIVADKTTAVYAAQAVCAALVARGRTGQGQHIRLSMLDTMVAFLWPEAMTQYTVVGREDAPQPAPRPDLIFKTLDGYITVGSLSDAEWRGLCEVIGRPEWIDDPRFRTPSARSANAAERLTLVGEILATGHSQDWLDRLDAADVPCAPVLRRARCHQRRAGHQQRTDRTDGTTDAGHGPPGSPRRAVRPHARRASPALPRVSANTPTQSWRRPVIPLHEIEALKTSRAASSPGAKKMSNERILWGAGTSRTIRPHWALHELGLEFELRPDPAPHRRNPNPRIHRPDRSAENPIASG